MASVRENEIVDVWFDHDKYEFFHEGLKKLLARLQPLQDAKEIFGLDEQPLEREINRIEAMIEWGTRALAESGSRGREISPKPSYGSLRLLKAGGLLQIREYEQKKEEYLRKNRVIPKTLMQSNQ